MIKDKILHYCKSEIEKQISDLESMISSINEARNSETKSSAGDKFETSREMMQMEENKLQQQIQIAIQSKNTLSLINPDAYSETIKLGSLIQTDKNSFFISIGLGKIHIDDKIHYCISSNSPIGLKFLGKSKGDSIEINGNKMTVIEVY